MRKKSTMQNFTKKHVEEIIQRVNTETVYPGSKVAGYLANDKVMFTDVEELRLLLRSKDPVVLSHFYNGIGLPCESLGHMEMIAGIDIGAITAMEMKTVLRQIFWNWKGGNYENRQIVFENDVRRSCKLAGTQEYRAFILEMFTGFLTESATIGEFIDKVFSFSFTTTKYMRFLKERLYSRLFEETQKTFNPADGAAFAVGYLKQIDATLFTKRNSKELVSDAYEILYLFHKWHFYGIEFNRNTIAWAFEGFSKGKENVATDCHLMQIARIIWFNSSDKKQPWLYELIEGYENTFEVIFEIDRVALHEKFQYMSTMLFSYKNAFDCLGGIISVKVS